MSILSNFGPITLAIIGGLIVIGATAWSNSQQYTLQEKLQKKTEEVAALSQKSLNMIQGGDSYPILSSAFDDENNKIIFSVSNDGDYPLFDLDLYISEMSDHSSILSPFHKKFAEIGSGKTISDFYTITMPEEIMEKEIRVTTMARNGTTDQTYKVFRSNDTLGVRKPVIYRDGKLIKTE